MGLILAVVQARLHSTRVPRKMLADVGGHPLLWWAWSSAVLLYGLDAVVIACPAGDLTEFQLALPDALVFGWPGDEHDVLGRLHACAHQYRTDPQSLLSRITPDDFPIDPLRETCRLHELDHWHATVTDPHQREHIGTLFTPRVEVNTLVELDTVRRLVAQANVKPD